MSIEPTRPLLIPIPDSCAMLGGITRPTLYDLINGGEIDRVKIGKRAFITAASIDAYVERQMKASAARLEANTGSAS
jgi:excisionase family DNA binding protein